MIPYCPRTCAHTYPKGIIIERRLFEVFVRILGGMGRSWFVVGVRLAVTRTECWGTRKSARKVNKQLLLPAIDVTRF